MLTNTSLKTLKTQDKTYKVADRDGLYVTVSPKGLVTFRYDYRLNGRRETLTLGNYSEYQASQQARDTADLTYGMALSLGEARALLGKAKAAVANGKSPAREKSDGKREQRFTDTFSEMAAIWIDGAGLADSTRAMRQRILDKDILPALGKFKLTEISTSQVMKLCDKIKARGAPAPAVQAREIIQQVYRHATDRGLKIENPAESIRASAIATFKARDRRLTPNEIGAFFNTLDTVGTLPTLKVALKFMQLTLARKGELLNATWPEVDFEADTWTIPAERMKARRAHTVYLSTQAMDLLVALKTLAGGSKYLLPGRYETDQPMSEATLNRVIVATIAKARKEGREIGEFGPHDMRRTASTLLHEAGCNSDWIEKCLAHEQKGVRAVYNQAEYSVQRRAMLQTWADMLDAFIAGAVTNTTWSRIVELLGGGKLWPEALATIQSTGSNGNNVIALRGAA
jgi:integrase